MAKFKVGFGYDVHQLATGESLILGGVSFDYHLGTVAHSDGDVLIHAICDALLGAAGLRDIGFYFPDTDNAFKGINSSHLLAKVADLVNQKGFDIGNIDATLVAEQPKINPKIEEMKTVLAAVLKIEPDDIGLKATTNEKMGFVGREDGMAAYAVVLLEKRI